MKVNDRRDAQQIESTKVYVNATDKFMSGWGFAENGWSYFVIACDNYSQARQATRWLQQRSEMKRVADSAKPRKAKGSHTSIVHFSETGAVDFWG